MALLTADRRKTAKKNTRPKEQEEITGNARSRFLRHVILCLVGLVMLYPLLWLVSSSLKPNDQIFKNLGLWPQIFDFSNYTDGWTALNHPFHLYIINSMILVFLNVAGNIISCSLAAYAFARMEFAGRKLFFTLMLGTLMLPGHVLLIPQYILFAKLGWLDTYLPLVVPHFMATNAFYIFLMVQFMRALPKELDDAAQIDGCGPFSTFWKVIMPLCLPAMATTAIFTFIATWNDFFGPLLYIQNQELYTVTLALRSFMDSEGQSMWGQMFAMSVVSLAPIIGFFIAGQKYLVNGIATTGLK